MPTIKKTIYTDENGYFETLVEIGGGPGIKEVTVEAGAPGQNQEVEMTTPSSNTSPTQTTQEEPIKPPTQTTQEEPIKLPL